MRTDASVWPEWQELPPKAAHQTAIIAVLYVTFCAFFLSHASETARRHMRDLRSIARGVADAVATAFIAGGR